MFDRINRKGEKNMGMGICAVLPLSFKNIGFSVLDVAFAKECLDNYNISDYKGIKIYDIKSDVLFNNYKDFLTEFYELIGEEVHKRTRLKPDSPSVCNMSAFMKEFSTENSMCVPYTSRSRYFFTQGCDCLEYWVFYSGSFKVRLDDEDTLQHFETALVKAMKNPLAASIKVGLEGMG